MKFSKSMMLVAVLVSTHAVTLFGLISRPGVTRATTTVDYAADIAALKAFHSKTGSKRTEVDFQAVRPHYMRLIGKGKNAADRELINKVGGLLAPELPVSDDLRDSSYDISMAKIQMTTELITNYINLPSNERTKERMLSAIAAYKDLGDALGSIISSDKNRIDRLEQESFQGKLKAD